MVVSASGQARVDAVARALRDAPPDAPWILLGATRSAVDDLVHDLAADGRAVFGIHRLSLLQLAAALAAPGLAAAGLAPASTLGAEALAARVAFEARRDDAIPRLAPVAGYPGFSRALARTLEELRLAGVSPDALAHRPDTRDVGILLQRFQAALDDAKLADRARLLRLALDGIDLPSPLPLDAARVVFVDVPLRSTLEGRFAAAVAARATSTTVLLPRGDTETRDTWAQAEGVTLATTDLDADEHPHTSGLARLRRHVFADELPPEGVDDDEVALFSAPGEGRECVEIARRILDESRRGVAFDEMAIFLRTPESYASLLETALRRAGVRPAFARGTRRPDPTGRAFLALLACKAEGLSAKRFAEYLSFSQVPRPSSDGGPPPHEGRWVPPADEVVSGPPETIVEPAGDDDADEVVQLSLFDAPADGTATNGDGDQRAAEARGDGGTGTDDGSWPDSDALPSLEGSLRAPWKWEEYLVEAAVIGGKDRWERRLMGLENELRVKLQALADDDPESPRYQAVARDLQNLGHLERFAFPVISLLADGPDEAPWRDWLDFLTDLAPRVLSRPDRVLEVLAELEPMAAVGPVSIEEVREVLTDRLSTLEPERPRTRYGRVFIGTPEEARGRRFRVVFVPALAERVFPQRPREDPLLLDAARDAIGARLSSQETRAHDERLRLLLALGAATDRVVLSYSRLDGGEARPRVPSFYALDVARALEGKIPDVEALERSATDAGGARLSWPAPQNPDRAVDAVEHDLAVLGPLLHGETTPVHEGRARYLLDLNQHLARSLRAQYARWRIRAWRPEDGIVRTTDELQAVLGPHRPAVRAHSVTALQRYAVCPYQFFLAAVLRLEPREDVEPPIRIDPLTRGQMLHEVQAATLRELREKGLLPVTEGRLPAAEEVLERTLDAAATRFADDLAPAIPRVWMDEIEGIRTDLRSWLRRMPEDESGFVPRHFELTFGLRPSPTAPVDPRHDPDSRADAVTLPGGWKLRGAIDLVEVDPGSDEVRVTDYKTGSDRTMPGLVVGGGEVLQPVLYGLAAQNLLQKTVTAGRLYFSTSRGGFGERVVHLDERARGYASDVLLTIDDAIMHGKLPPAPREDACALCDFRAVCGPSEERRLRMKDPSFLSGLHEIRRLP